MKKNNYNIYCVDDYAINELLRKLPERRLWMAVILNAISDACKNTNNKYVQLYKNEAISWLLKDNLNFCEVCELADISSQEMRNKIKEIFFNNR